MIPLVNKWLPAVWYPRVIASPQNYTPARFFRKIRIPRKYFNPGRFEWLLFSGRCSTLSVCFSPYLSMLVYGPQSRRNAGKFRVTEFLQLEHWSQIYLFIYPFVYLYMNKAWNKYNCLANSSKYYYVIYAVIKIWKF